MLLRMESVQRELEVVEDQNAAIQKLAEELRGQRGQRGQRGAEMTDAEREKIRQEAAAREKAVWDKLGGILLPNQVKRLKEISLQSQLRMGLVNALLDPQVAEDLNLTDAQKQQLNKIQTDSREAMRQAFQGGGRPDMEKMAAMRKENDSKAEAVLTADQKAKLEQMKGGKPFEFPAFGARGGRRAGGGNP